ncbi:serine hydrolase [Marivirga lumbricoides]|uniref:Serine hydrolase n=1 Tax=Marivirga lumbricoides TaxID=1046115 RepID=A0A2T4DTH8_9BACT|nr:serine hydrolase [Marivirga lumbricoides]
MSKKIILCFVISIIFKANSIAQVDKNSTLYSTILPQDSLLFNVGFNTCDISQFEYLLSDDLKFYHDKDGISDKTKFLYDLKNGLCKSPETRQVQRVLVKESIEIFPLYKNGVLYGAIHNGKHLFYESAESQPGIARFSNVWVLENGLWKLGTSLSYGHRAYEVQATEKPIFENNAEMEQWLKENKVPTLGLGLIENGALKQIQVFGEIKAGISAPYNTIFNVASLTKPVTAMVTLKLVSAGQWDLDEPIYKYWIDPDLKNEDRIKKLTTRHILSHQTGFPNWRENNENGKLHFEFTPGTQYQYSGEGFEYLRKALEKKFDKSLNQLATELIFEPLKMTDTQYIWNEATDESRVALGYDKEGNTYETYKRKNENAADDLLTTIEDYAAFLISTMKGEGLSEKVSKEMQSNQVATKNGKHFGLGFEVYNFKNGDYALSHGGADNGVQTIVFIFPKTQKGLIIFTNVDDGYKVYERILTHYLGDQGKEIIEIETK